MGGKFRKRTIWQSLPRSSSEKENRGTVIHTPNKRNDWDETEHYILSSLIWEKSNQIHGFTENVSPGYEAKETDSNWLTHELAIDCEMVTVRSRTEGKCRLVLARVSVVNANKRCIFDKHVKLDKATIVDYHTEVSGIRPEDLETGEDFLSVRSDVARLLKGRVLIGHAVKNDLQVLMLCHPLNMIRDTQRYQPFLKLNGGNLPGLKFLSLNQLGLKIQSGEHCSIQDASATMQLYLKCKPVWEKEIQRNGGQVPQSILLQQVEKKNIGFQVLKIFRQWEQRNESKNLPSKSKLASVSSTFSPPRYPSPKHNQFEKETIVKNPPRSPPGLPCLRTSAQVSKQEHAESRMFNHSDHRAKGVPEPTAPKKIGPRKCLENMFSESLGKATNNNKQLQSNANLSFHMNNYNQMASYSPRYAFADRFYCEPNNVAYQPNPMRWSKASQRNPEDYCVMCRTLMQKVIMLFPCEHANLCVRCYQATTQKHHKCPTCGSEVFRARHQAHLNNGHASQQHLKLMTRSSTMM